MKMAKRSGVRQLAAAFTQASLLAVEPAHVAWKSEAASKLTRSKRQQAAALHQSACGA